MLKDRIKAGKSLSRRIRRHTDATWIQLVTPHISALFDFFYLLRSVYRSLDFVDCDDKEDELGNSINSRLSVFDCYSASLTNLCYLSNALGIILAVKRRKENKTLGPA